MVDVDGAAGRARIARPSWPALAGLSGLAAFVACRVAIWLHSKVFIAGDTMTYAYRHDGVSDRGPLVSFTGHAPRPWGTPLFYAAFGSDTGRAFGQWVIGTVAWAVLAYAVWGLWRRWPARVLGGAGVLVLGLMPQVTNWDMALLSESLSISLGALALALFLIWRRRPAGGRVAAWLVGALAVCVLWWTFVRPELSILVLPLAAALAWAGWRDRTRRLSAWLAVGLMVLGVGWAALIARTIDRTYAGWGTAGEPMTEEMLGYRLRLEVLPDPQIKAVFQERLGMPDCAGTDAIAAGSAWKMLEFSQAYKACPALRAWGQRNATSSEYRFVLVAPDQYLRYTWSVLPYTVKGAAYADTGTVVPARVQRLMFPGNDWPVVVVFGGLAATLLAALVSGAWRRRRLPVVTAATVAGFSIVSILAGLMYSVGEFSRFGIQEALGLRLAVLLLGVAAVDTLIERVADRTARRASPGEPEDETRAVGAAAEVTA